MEIRVQYAFTFISEEDMGVFVEKEIVGTSTIRANGVRSSSSESRM